MADPTQLVSFVGVKECYQLGSVIECRYVLDSTFYGTSNDWIGLYKVGWRSVNNFETYVWVQLPAKDDSSAAAQGIVTFTAENLPKDSKEFYQFCYISSAKQVCGVSTPFQLTLYVDDLVEIQDPDDPNTMVIKTRSQLLEEQLASAKTNCLELQKEINLLQIELEAERTSKGDLINQLQVVDNLQQELNEERQMKELLQSELRELQEGLQAERKSNEHLHEQLRMMRDTLKAERNAHEEEQRDDGITSSTVVGAENREPSAENAVGESSISESRDGEQAEDGKEESLTASALFEDGAEAEAKKPSLTERIAGSVLKHLKRASDWFAEEDIDDETTLASASEPPQSTEKADESLRMCPVCAMAFESESTAEQISAHLEKHSGQVCPVCFMQFNQDYPEEHVMAHVNRCLDNV